ncbi:MAG: drug resistance transporter, EmrB/QacA subfamily [Frankiales bacterium]|nr:drug resistance transporter, EmrB/QacA subfamily [Frankiales bacterium]
MSGISARLANQRVAVSVVFVAVMFMNIMDVTIVNVALPRLGRDLGAAPTAVSAVSIGYLVSLAVVIPASGWLGDRFGTKPVLLTATVIFTVASALCGAAQTFDQLVIFRVLQGVGGGMLTPVGMAMLFRAFPPEERVRASSILTTPTALAPAIGPVLGGILVTTLSWRWVFYVNLPIGAFALIFGLVFLADQETAQERTPFDLPGFLLSGFGFAALMFGVSEGPERGWRTPVVLGSIIVGVILIAAMVRQQLSASTPLLKLRLYADRLFRSANAVIFLSTAAFLGVLYLVALFFQDGLGLSALQSGLSTFPEALGVMLGAQMASRVLYPRFGPRRLMAGGLVGIAVAMALMSLIDGRGDLWPMRLLMLLLGYCMAHVFVPTQAAAFARIAPVDTGRASTLFNAIRQLGGAVGVAVLTTALSLAGLGESRTSVESLHPYHVAFLVAAAMALAAAGFALTIHDEDAAATRVRRGRAASPGRVGQAVPAIEG